MSSEEGKGLTFGVISFYKAQALRIERALKRLGADEGRLKVGTVDSFQGMEFDVVFLSMVRTLPQNYKGPGTERKVQGIPAPAPSSAPVLQEEKPEEQPKPAKRKSFLSNIRDMLFGSVSAETRRAQERVAGITLETAMAPFEAKQKKTVPEINPAEQKQAQRLFGHLCLYNRLNVAMSRQKRLLVVAGDSELLKIPLAEQFIPGLVDFYATCEKEGVILQWQR